MKFNLALMAVKFIVVIDVLFLLLQYLTPKPACWKEPDAPAYLKLADQNTRVIKIDGQLCWAIPSFYDLLCKSHSKGGSWWSSASKSDPMDFCLDRGSAYMSVITQLAVVFLFHMIHYCSLSCRCFSKYSPLDLVPAFLTFCALNSVIITQTIIHHSWLEYWLTHKYLVPSESINHDLAIRLLGLGMVLVIFEWMIIFAIYNPIYDAKAAVQEEDTGIVFSQLNFPGANLSSDNSPVGNFPIDYFPADDLPSDNFPSCNLPSNNSPSIDLDLPSSNVPSLHFPSMNSPTHKDHEE